MKPTREMIEQEIERQRAGLADGSIRSKRSPLLYALKLERGHFYECKPCRGSNTKEVDQFETHWTLDYMWRYGWRNVRGGYFCHVDEQQTEKALRAHGVFDAIQQVELKINHNR